MLPLSIALLLLGTRYALATVSVFNVPASSLNTLQVDVQTVVVPRDLIGASGGPLIVHVHHTQLVDNSISTAIIHTFIEGVLRTGRRGRLVLLLTPAPEGTISLRNKVDECIKQILTAATGVSVSDIASLIDISYYDLPSMSDEDHAQLRNELAQVTSSPGSPAKSAPAPVEVAASSYDVEASLAARDMRGSLLQLVQSRVGVAPSLVTLMAKTTEALDEHDAKHAAILTTFRDSRILKDASLQTRAELAFALELHFRRLVSSYTAASRVNFDRSAVRVSPDANLRKKLRKLASAITSKCEASTASLRTELLAVLEQRPSGLLGVSRGSRVSTHLFSAQLELTQLRRSLEIAVEDRVTALFLLGAYNPFVRNYPFPPLHINLNYLIDPRAVAFGLEYNGLYDEHLEGPAPQRADGLVLPGVSQVVFHPNQHPVPREDVPWWKTLVDFYRDDDEEDDASEE